MSEPINVPAEEPSGLAYLFGFYLGFRLFIMLLAVVVLGLTPQAGVMCDLAIGFLLFAVALFCCLGGSRRDLHLWRTSSSRWAILFILVAGCSLVWSVTPSLSAAVAYWCAMAANCGVVVLLMRTQSVESVAQALLKGFAHGACMVAIVAWLLPGTDENRLGYDGLIGTNVIGYLCAFGFYCAQYVVVVRKERHTLALVLLGVTMLRSLSKTTIIAFLVSQALLLFGNGTIPRRKRMQIALAALALMLPFWTLLSSYIDNYASSTQPETLTGRLGIWAIMISDGIEKPLLGHGFHSVWQVIPPFGPDQFEVRHAHNEIIQQFYAYGAMGVLLFCGIYTSFFLQVRKLARSPLRSFLFSLLIFVLIRGVADTESFDLSLPMWMILLFSVLMREARKEHCIVSEAQEPNDSDEHLLDPGKVANTYPA
jgi:exopolysaccharide production protein ExoQ